MKRLKLIGILLSIAFCAQNQNIFPAGNSGLNDTLSKIKKTNKAFTYGEKLSYRIHYGILDGGKAKFVIADKPEMVNGRNTYHVKVTGNSAGLVDLMFKVKDEFESFIDEESVVPLKATKKVREGKYTDADFILFDHERHFAASRRGKTEIETNSQDVVSAIYYARITDMGNAKIGDLFPVPFYLDGKTYELRFRYVGKENISTSKGIFRCLKVKPQLIEGRIFKDNDALTLWVTDDENHIPIRVESDIFMGSIKADIIDFSGIKNPLSSKIK